MDGYELVSLRNNKVVKANALVQQSRHSFSVQQQKVLLFLISQLKPDQKEFTEQVFDIAEFCHACGIVAGGDNYKDLKEALLGLKNKGFWLTIDDEEVTVSWVSRAKVAPKSGKVKITLDEMMKPFLLELRERFTAYELKYTLTMRSKYSVRLYELLKSYAGGYETVRFDLDKLQTRVGSEYIHWYDIKRKVLEVAVKEINEVSDLIVSYESVKKGRSFVAVLFSIAVKKNMQSQIQTERAIYQRIKGNRHHEPDPPIPGQIALDGSVIEE